MILMHHFLRCHSHRVPAGWWVPVLRWLRRLTQTNNANQMKLKKLLTVGLCSVFALMTIGTTPARAEEEKEGKEEATKIPDTVEGIFKAIHEHHMALAEIVKTKKLAAVHVQAFAIRDLANALPAKVAADKKKSVEGTAKNITKLAGDLDESGDASDQAKTEANLKKMDGMIKVLETQCGQMAMPMPEKK